MIYQMSMQVYTDMVRYVLSNCSSPDVLGFLKKEYQLHRCPEEDVSKNQFAFYCHSEEHLTMFILRWA